MSSARGLGTAKKAGVAYTVLFAAGSFLSIKRDYPAEALGIKFRQTTTRSVLTGLHGAGLAPPWNMIVQMWLALWLAGASGRKGRWARAYLALLASVFIAGQVSEPVSHKIVTGELPAADSAVAVASIAVPLVMLGGALVSLVDDEERS